MIASLIVGWLLTGFFIWLSVFLGKELLKKFRLQEQFEAKEGYCYKIIYHYLGGKDKAKGMRTIVLTGEKPFEFLVGFKFPLGGTDWFAVGESFPCDSEYHLAALSTYLARGPVEFRFLIKTRDSENIVFLEEREIAFAPNVVAHPHFFQRWGLFA